MPRPKKPDSRFRYFDSSPVIIRLVVTMYVRFPLSLRNAEELLAERGVDTCHEIVGIGGLGLVRCLRRISNASASARCEALEIGAGTEPLGERFKDLL